MGALCWLDIRCCLFEMAVLTWINACAVTDSVIIDHLLYILPFPSSGDAAPGVAATAQGAPAAQAPLVPPLPPAEPEEAHQPQGGGSMAMGADTALGEQGCICCWKSCRDVAV